MFVTQRVLSINKYNVLADMHRCFVLIGSPQRLILCIGWRLHLVCISLVEWSFLFYFTFHRYTVSLLQMLIAIDNILNLHQGHTYTQVSSCALEVADYISNHDNWQQPILPEESGCSTMTFDPVWFDFLSYLWVCQSNLQGKIIHDM